ncbi:uncharacterized protein LOC141507280 isoform X2 [Macrotis lagotis]
MPYLKHEARTTQPLPHPCYKSKSIPSQWPKQPSTAAQLSCMDHKAIPLPYLNHQGVTKASSPCKQHTANSIFTVTKPDFRSRVTAIPLTSAKQHLMPSLFKSKYQCEQLLDSNHGMEAASGPNHFPKISADFGQLPEDLTHFSQHPPSSKFHCHQAEFPFIDNRTMAVNRTKTFPKYQARVTHEPVKSVHSFEALPKSRLQDRVLTTKHHITGVPSAPCPNHWSKSLSFKTSELDHWVQTKTRKILQSEHRLRETASLLRCIDKCSKDPSILLSDLNGKTRAATACPRCPPHWSIATASPSSGPNHQARTTLKPSQDFKSLEAAPSFLEEPSANTISLPFTKASLGPDHKTEDTSGLLPEHQVAPIIIPVCLNHCKKAAQDSHLEAITLFFPRPHKSTPTGSNVQFRPSQHTPGLDVQTVLPLVHHQETAMKRRQKRKVEVLRDVNPKASTPKGLGDLVMTPVDLDTLTMSSSKPVYRDTLPFRCEHKAIDLDPLTISLPKSDYKTTLPLSYECKAIALPRNEYSTESAASDPNSLQTISSTDYDNQEISQLDLDSSQKLTQSNSDCGVTCSPSPDDHQTKNVQNCHKQFISQDKLDQGKTKPPGKGHQAIALTDQDYKDKFSKDLKPQDKTEEGHWETLQLNEEQKDRNPPGSDCHITLPPSNDYKDTFVLGFNDLFHAAPEQQEIMLQEVDYQRSTSTGQARWETSPLSRIDPKSLVFPGPVRKTTPSIISSPRVIIPHTLDQQVENHSDSKVQGTIQNEQILFILKDEQECEVLPPGINDKVMTTEDLSHKSVTLSDLDFQDIAQPGPEDQTPMPLHTDQQTEVALDSNAKVSFQIEQDHWQAMPLGTHNRTTITEVWDHEIMLTLSLDLMNTMPSNSDHRATHPLSSDFQSTPPLTTDHQEDVVSDAKDKVKVKVEEDHQDTILSSIKLQEVTLSGVSSQNELQFIPDHQSGAVPDLSIQATSPLDPHQSTKMLVDSRQVRPSSSPQTPFVLLSSPKNQTEAKSDVTNPKGTILSLDEKKITPRTIYRAKISSGPIHSNQVPIACDYQPEAELKSEHPDKVQPRFPYQDFSRKKRQILWRLNYIKPYTVEGGDVPEKIIDDIICTIPQDEIKNDICRQIVLQKMKRMFNPYCSDQGIAVDYPVCLICVSWIPNGCPHVWGMKYLYETQLLAIPMPLLNSEEINVKFVLQVNYTNECSIFTLPYPYYNLEGHLAHSLNSPVSSHSDLGLSVSSRGKWLDFIFGKDPQPKRRTLSTSQWPYKGKIAIKKNGSREEVTSKEHRTFLRSILDMFQKKQRRN